MHFGTARFGTGMSPAGVTGEPPNGANGYTRPTITVTATANQVVVTSAISLGAITADLGPVRAVSLHDAAGNCRVCGPLADQVMLSNGSTRTIPANAITFTLPLAGV
jgi:hypothetical protein